jgi:hypothetical protein
MTERKPMSQARRHAIFTERAIAHNLAPCCVCGGLVHRWKDRWIAEHVTALGIGGRDINTNVGVAHYECALAKTRDDMKAIAKAKRIKARHEGTQRKSRRGFWRPANAVYDWNKQRYVWEN